VCVCVCVCVFACLAGTHSLFTTLVSVCSHVMIETSHSGLTSENMSMNSSAPVEILGNTFQQGSLQLTMRNTVFVKLLFIVFIVHSALTYVNKNKGLVNIEINIKD